MTKKDDIKILDDVSHVLLRPGMYIGPITTETKEFWIPSKGQMVKKEVEYIPGLYKIFCEVLDNAIDEHQRGYCTEIIVDVDTEKNSYTVHDNGRGISPEKHEYGKHTPEVVFTMLRSGSNFDDTKRETIGMNGVGAALTNIFSSKFVVEIQHNGQFYLQTFRNNNKEVDEPTIRKKRSKKNGTKITFYPDTNIFKKRLNPVLIHKRCLELAYMFPDLTINLTIDGKSKNLVGKKFEELIKMFGTNYEIVEDKDAGVRLAVLNSDGNGFDQFSNVNGADTWRGGSHVDAVKDIFVSKFREILKKKYKLEVSTYDASKHILVVLFQKLNAPHFDGQSKEKLSNDKNDMSAIFENVISSRKLTIMANGLDVIAEQIYESVNSKNNAKEMAELRKMQREVKKKKIPKLIDANSRQRSKCTLFITEGDSAAIGISSVRDPKFHASLPLRGKILNVSDMSPKSVIKNAEIQTLMSAIGLEIGKSPIKISRGKAELITLRYGNISILTDADHDGSAIRCLLINFFHTFWPELFQFGFITISQAPIYRCVDRKSKKEHFFYERNEYNQFLKNKNSNNYEVSYFKGLGGCNKKAWNFFINESPKMYKVLPGESSQEMLEMVFGSNSDKRKEWLR